MGEENQWARHFFGRWDDWQAAFAKYAHDVHDIQRGHQLKLMVVERLAITAVYLVNHFFGHREAWVQPAELAKQNWVNYKAIGEVLVKQQGRYTNV